ncbi:C-X-C motif chemokine 11 isoform X2 [Choloepus didactylus]|uniref:C-X-C motif chemokine 11 isoform X2 n=1 Tax=Choloepus didactylus TaxID=27675 RepID=UPI0018A065DD|nr:C-X-C motif chemokine 11 isoform X2 [Choloepus didactylus]
MCVKGMAIALAVLFCATIVPGPGVKAVKVTDIEKASIIYPSNNCDKIEVIVTLKAHKGERCLNPRSKQANFIIKKVERMNFLKISNI